MRTKLAFIPGGDPSLGGAPPGMPPGAPPGAPPMDPAMMGAMGPPPMDPAMMGGMPPPMDPAMMGAMGGMPPMDPAMMGGMPPPPTDPAMAGGAPPAGGANAPPMKVDLNAEMALIKKMLAKVLDSLNIPIRAQEMVVSQEDIQKLTPKQEKVKAGSIPGIGGIEPIQGAMPQKTASEILADLTSYVDNVRRYANAG